MERGISIFQGHMDIMSPFLSNNFDHIFQIFLFMNFN